MTYTNGMAKEVHFLLCTAGTWAEASQPHLRSNSLRTAGIVPSAMHVFETLRTLQFYAVLLHSFCDVQEADLDRSMQPGVTDGCLEFYQTREAALEAYNVADSEWIGLGGPPLALAVLCIQVAHMKACISAQTMSRQASKLRVWRNMSLRGEKYTITIEAAVPFNTTPGTDASVPADITQRLVSQDTVLYAGFLLAYLPQLKTTAGLHWTTQPAARGRITLYSNADEYQKYNYWRGDSAQRAPEWLSCGCTLQMEPWSS